MPGVAVKLTTREATPDLRRHLRPDARPWERGWLGRRRHELLEGLTGRVLDIGVGTGANLARYRDAAEVTLAEPDAAMRARLSRKLGQANVPVRLSDAPA